MRKWSLCFSTWNYFEFWIEWNGSRGINTRFEQDMKQWHWQILLLINIKHWNKFASQLFINLWGFESILMFWLYLSILSILNVRRVSVSKNKSISLIILKSKWGYKRTNHKLLFTIETINNVNDTMFMNFQVGLNDSGEYRCGSDLTGEAFVRVNVVAGETEQELKSFHLDSDSIASRAARLEMFQILILLTFSLFLQIRWQEWVFDLF